MLLLVSLATLALAPAIFKAIARLPPAAALLDGFVVVAVTGLVCLHVLPEAMERAGWLAGAAAVVGLVLPTLLEKLLHGLHTSVHRGTVLLVAFGLAVHAFFDGLALSAHGIEVNEQAHAQHDHLGLAVVFHRLPAALLIWSAARPVSRRFAWALLSCIGAATVLGFFAAGWAHPGEGWAIVDGLVAGALLHVALAAHGHWLPAETEARAHDHAHHSHDHAQHDHAQHDRAQHDHAQHDHAQHDHAQHDHAQHDHAHEHHAKPAPSFPVFAGTGALLAIGMLLMLGEAQDAEDTLSSTFMALLFESAPALVLAFVGAGLVRGLLTPASTRWISQGGAALQATKGMAFGLPLPVCSCGVLPLYEGLVRGGVPVTAGLAFLIATPELGLDAILISVPLLGGELTVVRLIAAAVVALLAAVILGRVLRLRSGVELPAADARDDTDRATRIKEGLRFGLGELVDHTLPWVLVGLAVAAICQPLLAHAGLQNLPGGIDVLLFALIGAPIYVCATGATPLAAVLIYAGVSPGAAIAFLLTGPATNVTTFGVLARLHGRRGAALFGVGVLGLAVLAGLLVNLVVPMPTLPPLNLAGAHQPSLTQMISLGVLGLMFLASLLRQGPRGLIGQITQGVHAH
ncbi:MAG: uncharacterized membrane protein YraQ (UPF0718 family) [Bradymonadia bacterium]|jgi:uncharacterized membrane protein YraQ (UPF0718 family)